MSKGGGRRGWGSSVEGNDEVTYSQECYNGMRFCLKRESSAHSGSVHWSWLADSTGMKFHAMCQKQKKSWHLFYSFLQFHISSDDGTVARCLCSSWRPYSWSPGMERVLH